jgi:hypothetical protein
MMKNNSVQGKYFLFFRIKFELRNPEGKAYSCVSGSLVLTAVKNNCQPLRGGGEVVGSARSAVVNRFFLTAELRRV